MDKLVDCKNKEQDGAGKGRLSRRVFLGWLMGLSITATLGGMLTAITGCRVQPRTRAKIEDERILVGTKHDFPLNTGKVVQVRGRPVIVTNTRAAGLKAFSAIWTHEGCIVRWAAGYIMCPCHDGSYDAQNGMVISGPPPRSLQSYELAVQGKNVYVDRPPSSLSG